MKENFKTKYQKLKLLEPLPEVKEISETVVTVAESNGELVLVDDDNESVRQHNKATLIEEEIKKLALLDSVERDLRGKEIMKKYKVKANTIDTLLSKELIAIEFNESSLFMSDQNEPWPEVVDGASLLDEISSVVTRHLIVPEGIANTLSLWVILTYCYDNFRILPQVAIYSPEKRCGKTVLLEILGACVNRPLSSSNMTPATVFRSIEAFKPTLIIDEADTFFKKNSEMQGVCNSGHAKNNAFVLRATKGETGIRRFSTWCPKVIAMIGKHQGTQHDRSIIVEMRRRLPSEKVETVPSDILDRCNDIRRKCKRWVADNSDKLTNYVPEIEDVDNDRRRDNWAPLFTIAGCASDQWLEKVNLALLNAVQAGRDDDEESITIELLNDICGIFKCEKEKTLCSEMIVDQLRANREAQWNYWPNGRGLTQHSLAKLLRKFKIKPQQVMMDGRNRRSYRWEDFLETFQRYCII